MNYLSPFHILPDGFEVGSSVDKNTLKQARKVILAEFELQGDTTIFINEREYDKDSILKFFSDLEKDTNLQFHSIIFQNKSLLNFLEKGNIEDYRATANFIVTKAYPKQEAFTQFIAPYFVHHYNQLLFNTLRHGNNSDLFLLTEDKFPLPSQYESTAYQAAYRWFHQKQREVKDVEQALIDGDFVSGSQIYELIDPNFINNFNQMPLYFFEIRDRYAFKLYELVVLLNNKYNRTELARSVLDAGILLNVDDRTHEYFVKADGIVDKTKTKTKRSNWIWVYLVAQVLLVAVRFSTCNNSSSSSSLYDYRFPDTYNSGYSLSQDSIFNSNLTDEMSKDLEKLDSISKALKDKYKSQELIDSVQLQK